MINQDRLPCSVGYAIPVCVDRKTRRNFECNRKFDSLFFRYFSAFYRRKQPAATIGLHPSVLCLRVSTLGVERSGTPALFFNCYIYKGWSRRRTHDGSSASGLENSVVFGHRCWMNVPFFSSFCSFSFVNRYLS